MNLHDRIRALEEALAHSSRIAEALDQHVYSGELLADGTYVETFAGPGSEAIAGEPRPPGEDSELFWTRHIHPDDRARYHAGDAALQRGEPVVLEYRMVRADGGIRRVSERVVPTVEPDGRILLAGVVSDVTERHVLLERLDWATAALSRVDDAYLYTSEVLPDGEVRDVYQGPGRAHLLGGEPPAGIDPALAWDVAIHPADRALWERALDRVRRGLDVDAEYRIRGFDGHERWIWDRSRPRPPADGRRFSDGVAMDVTERRQVADALAAAHAEAERLARVDPLCGVANRRHFTELLEQGLSRTGRRRGLAVLLCDIDRFKSVNDAFGHRTGDEVLVEVAQRLQGAVRAADCVARFGGEEFAVLVDGVGDDAALRRVGEALRAAIGDRPVPTRAGEIAVTISVGAAQPGEGGSADAVMSAADEALYGAKRAGRDRVLLDDDLLLRQIGCSIPETAMLAETIALAVSVREGMPELHAEQVSELAERTALELGCPPAEVLRCRIGGLLHDLGTVAVADEILHKPGPLDDEEWRIMRAHPAVGERLACRIPGLGDAGCAIRHHHERVDGTGYPDGLAAADIPLEARIVAAADAFASMTSRRSYRAARSWRSATAELRAVVGTQLDADVVQALLAVLAHDRRERGTRISDYHRRDSAA